MALQVTTVFGKECVPAIEERAAPVVPRAFFLKDPRYVLGGYSGEESLWDSQTNQFVGDRRSSKWLVEPSGEWIVTKSYNGGSPIIRSLGKVLRNEPGIEIQTLHDPTGIRELERTSQFVRVLWLSQMGRTAEVKLHLDAQGEITRVEKISEGELCSELREIGQTDLTPAEKQNLETQLKAREGELADLSVEFLKFNRVMDLTTNRQLRQSYSSRSQELSDLVQAKAKEVSELTTRLHGQKLTMDAKITASSDGKHFTWYNSRRAEMEILKVEGNRCIVLKRTSIYSSARAGLSRNGEIPPVVESRNGYLVLKTSDGRDLRISQSENHLGTYGITGDGRVYALFRRDQQNFFRLWDPYQLEGTAEQKLANCLKKPSDEDSSRSQPQAVK